MRSQHFAFVVAASIALGAAAVAGAAPLNWEGTSITSLADYPWAYLYGGGVATVNQSAGGVPAHLNTMRLAASRGQIHGTFTIIVTDPVAKAGNPIFAIHYHDVQALTGTFSGISGGVASNTTGVGTLPIGGLIKLCWLSTSCTNFIPLPLTVSTPGGGVIGLGVGGLITVNDEIIRISLQNAPWTVKTATVEDQITTVGGVRTTINLTARGWAHGPNSLTTSTAAPGGVIQLVTPQQVMTNLPFGSDEKMASIVRVIIHFIPEPGLPLLLGAGVVGLACLGRRRMRP